MRVEIVSDLVCPWCFIGKRRFERALYDLRHAGVRLDVQVH
ncbi:MAG: DsbA family oxidoreductase, partial [Acidimicrobiia bacterium]|nr:DsbA family oxidoreductase [Acidimicrobiia bacterium]